MKKNQRSATIGRERGDPVHRESGAVQHEWGSQRLLPADRYPAIPVGLVRRFDAKGTAEQR